MAEKPAFLPRESWNFDPVYTSYARLYVVDVLNMHPYPASASGPGGEAFAYKNHPIYRVDIMGLVVSVAEREKFFHYAVDDGTGVIQCCCWKPRQEERFEESRHQPSMSGDGESELATSLQRKMEESDSQMLAAYDLGDLIHVRGRIKMYRGNMEVSASYFRRITDPTYQTEMRRMEEIPTLYRSVYDQPFVLTQDMKHRLGDRQKEEKLGLKREAVLVEDVQAKVQELIAKKTIQNFYIQELETVKELLDIASQPCSEYQQASGSDTQTQVRQLKTVFRRAVERLEQAGKVFRSGAEQGLYEAVEGNPRLNDRILEVLRSDCQQPKYESGCHFMHVMDRLNNMVGYEQIGPEAIKSALSWLESQSDVISTTPKHYMAIT